MIRLAGADLVLPDRVLGRRHARARRRSHRRSRPRRRGPPAAATSTSISPVTTSSPASSTCTCTASRGRTRSTAAARSPTMAARLPRYGVTAFCPTSLACDAGRRCARMLAARPRRANRRAARQRARAARAPREQLHQPRLQGRAAARAACACRSRRAGGASRRRIRPAREILEEIAAARPDVGIVTLAPELDGGARSDSRPGVARAITSRSGTRARPTNRRMAGDPRRRAAGHAPLQPHAAARPSRARTGRRGARVTTTSSRSSSATACTCIPR